MTEETIPAPDKLAAQYKHHLQALGKLMGQAITAGYVADLPDDARATFWEMNFARKTLHHVSDEFAEQAFPDLAGGS